MSKKYEQKTKLSFSEVFRDIKEKLSKITSYKIKENKITKQAEITIQWEMKMTEEVTKKAKTRKAPDLHPELKKFIEEQNKRWAEQNKRWESQTELNKEIKKFIKDQNQKWNQQIKTNQVILTSIQEILLRLERIEKLPTIQKELIESNK